MNVKYIKLSRKCKYHDALYLGIAEKCHYCKRAEAHNRYQKISPEEILLGEIFGDGRFIRRVVKHSPNYKGKRPIRNRP